MIYLDHNATSPPYSGLLEAMAPYLGEYFGNPSSQLYELGKESRRGVETAREELSQLIDCDPDEVVFTSGGTEALSQAFLGYLASLNIENLITLSAVEHPAVSAAASFVSKISKCRLHNLAVTKKGELDLSFDMFPNSNLPNASTLTAIMAANNETGIVHNIDNIKNHPQHKDSIVIVDAVQLIGKKHFSFKNSPANILALSAHKFGGPKGVGALIIKKSTEWAPAICGGGQEQGRRGGTESVALIVGLGYAAKAAKKSLAHGSTEDLESIRNSFEDILLNEVNDVKIIGKDMPRLPNTSFFIVPEIIGSELVSAVSKDLCLSSGSACKSGSLSPAKSLVAMGYSKAEALSSIRVSFGSGNSLSEVPKIVNYIKTATRELRKKHNATLSSLLSGSSK